MAPDFNGGGFEMSVLTDLATPIIMGVLLGGLYAVIALGLSLIFGVVKEINIAHGDLVIFGSYFGYIAMTIIGIDPILSLVIGIPLLFGIGFAIPINSVKRILQELQQSGHVDRSFWTGIHYDQLTRTIARFLGLESGQGVIVSDIDKYSPADKAGLKIGDVITEIDGKEITDFRDVKNIIDDLDLKPGDIMVLKIFRKKQYYTIKVLLEKHPRSR